MNLQQIKKLVLRNKKLIILILFIISYYLYSNKVEHFSIEHDIEKLKAEIKVINDKTLNLEKENETHRKIVEGPPPPFGHDNRSNYQKYIDDNMKLINHQNKVVLELEEKIIKLREDLVFEKADIDVRKKSVVERKEVLKKIEEKEKWCFLL